MNVGLLYQWGRKDAFPGADGSTIQENGTATTIPIYGASGNTLTEGSTGVRFVNITTAGVLSGNTSQVYAVKNPLTFIYNQTSPNDWYCISQSSQNHTLWGDNSTKSSFDPCPAGWQTPTDASITFGDFITTIFPLSGSGTNLTNGRIYNKTAWFPITGGRSYNGGALLFVGSYGYYWSTSASSAVSKSLLFGVNNINTIYTNPRASGFSVRCIQE